MSTPASGSSPQDKVYQNFVELTEIDTNVVGEPSVGEMEGSRSISLISNDSFNHTHEKTDRVSQETIGQTNNESIQSQPLNNKVNVNPPKKGLLQRIKNTFSKSRSKAGAAAVTGSGPGSAATATSFSDFITDPNSINNFRANELQAKVLEQNKTPKHLREISSKMTDLLMKKLEKASLDDEKGLKDLIPQFEEAGINEADLKEMIKNKTDTQFIQKQKSKINEKYCEKLRNLDERLKNTPIVKGAIKIAKKRGEPVKLRKEPNGLPFAVVVDAKGNIEVQSKIVLGTGTDKVVKYGFNLTKGTVSARTSGSIEKSWTTKEYSMLKKLGVGEGLPKVQIYKYEGGKGEKIGLAMMKYDCEVSALVKDKAFRESPAAQYNLLTQLATGLATCHEKNIVHNDFATRNCFVNFDPKNPKKIEGVVADYGMAVDFSIIEKLSAEDLGKMGGTERYLPPEANTFTDLLPDYGKDTQSAFFKQSDVYAFATSLYEILTDTTPEKDELPPWRSYGESQYTSTDLQAASQQLRNHGVPENIIGLFERSILPNTAESFGRPTMTEWTAALEQVNPKQINTKPNQGVGHAHIAAKISQEKKIIFADLRIQLSNNKKGVNEFVSRVKKEYRELSVFKKEVERVSNSEIAKAVYLAVARGDIGGDQARRVKEIAGEVFNGQDFNAYFDKKDARKGFTEENGTFKNIMNQIVGASTSQEIRDTRKAEVQKAGEIIMKEVKGARQELFLVLERDGPEKASEFFLKKIGKLNTELEKGGVYPEGSGDAEKITHFQAFVLNLSNDKDRQEIDRFLLAGRAVMNSQRDVDPEADEKFGTIDQGVGKQSYEKFWGIMSNWRNGYTV